MRPIAFGDVNGDGLPDVFVDTLYLNHGGGVFNRAQPEGAPLDDDPFGILAAQPRSAAFADVDSDGDLDLFIGTINGLNLFLENKNRGGAPLSAWDFATDFGIFDSQVDAIAIDSSAAWAVSWGDADRDGQLDLAIATDRAVNRVYSRKVASAVTGVGFKYASVEAHFFPDNPDFTTATPTLGTYWNDIDRDGFPDLLVLRGGGRAPELYRTTAVGTFVKVAHDLPPGAQRADYADCNGDGLDDLFLHHDAMRGASIGVYASSGAFEFSKVADIRLEDDSKSLLAYGAVRRFSLFDIDGDGDVDILSTQGGERKQSETHGGGSRLESFFHLNEGNCSFATEPGFALDGIKQWLLEENTNPNNYEHPLVWSSHAAGDLDGDGDVDVIASLAAHQDVILDFFSVFENLGNGSFVVVVDTGQLLWEYEPTTNYQLLTTYFLQLVEAARRVQAYYLLLLNYYLLTID
jgi:hypothetical protein